MRYPNQAWDTPVYYEPACYRPKRRHHALSISLALCVVTTGLIGSLIYHRLDTLSDIDTYVAMGPSQSHIEADNAASEPTLLVTLTPPVYAASQTPGSELAYAVPTSAQTNGADAGAISQRLSNDSEAQAAEAVATDDLTASYADLPVAADSLPANPDPVTAPLREETAESLGDSAM